MFYLYSRQDLAIYVWRHDHIQASRSKKRRPLAARGMGIAEENRKEEERGGFLLIGAEARTVTITVYLPVCLGTWLFIKVLFKLVTARNAHSFLVRSQQCCVS